MKLILRFCLLITLSLLLCFNCSSCNKAPEASCSDTQGAFKPAVQYFPDEPAPDKVLFENELYKVYRKNGQCYITIYACEKTPVGDDSDIYRGIEGYIETPEGFKMTIFNFSHPPLKFNSVEELIQAVIVDGLSEEQVDTLAKCIFNHYTGYAYIEEYRIFDLERFYDFNIPEGFELEALSWYGNKISFNYSSNTEKFKSLSVILMEKPLYDHRLELEKEYIKEPKEDEERPGVTHYHRMSLVCENAWYRFQANEIDYTVFETFSEKKYHRKCQDKIYMFGNRKNLYFTATLDVEPHKHNELLDQNWLSQIRPVAYVRY